MIGRSRRARRCQAALDELPDLIDLIVIAVRSGATPAAAIRLAAGEGADCLRPTVDEVVLRLDRGQRLADALGALSDALGPGASVLVDGLTAADRYGLPIGPVLDRLADDARAERRRRGEQAARTLPVKLAFPLVACTLPSFVVLAIVPALLGALSTLRGTAP